MSPFKGVRPATEREDLIVSFPNRFRGPKKKSGTRELLKRVELAMEENSSGIAALDFEGNSSKGEAYEVQNKLRDAGCKKGLDLQTTIKDYPEETTLFVRRFKESG